MKKQISNHQPIMKTMENNLILLPTPSSISYMWNMGSMLGATLIIQMISGVMLSMHFTAETSMAFESTIHIMRDVSEGNSMRAIHSNGASMFFMIMYLHIMRGMLNSSFKKTETWATGIVMVLILMATAFMGYVLPWGQMSFWGATVITNLASAVPIWGEQMVQWLWGGFSVSNPTLNRFFSIHFMLPFILAAMSGIHLVMLHKTGSSNPTGTSSKKEMTTFHPLFSWKDSLTPALMVSILMILSEKSPAILMDPENFSQANPMVTPTHIQPEWYFLFAYAILRSIPNKLGGVIALVSSILILLALPLIKKSTTSSKFKPNMKNNKMNLAATFVLLTWSGANEMEEPFMLISKIISVNYFAIILM